jgi:CRP-like cAMP-binding protein
MTTETNWTHAFRETGRTKRFGGHRVLFTDGDVADDVMMISRGHVKLRASVHGRDVVLDVLGPGQLLGELSAIDGLPRSATAVTLDAVEVVMVPIEEFRTMMAQRPDMVRDVLQMLSARVRDASRRQAENGALDATGRLCRRLVEMADRFGAQGRESVSITAPLTQSDIAAWAGLSRESVVKSLHSLRRLGWVTTGPGTITVLEFAAVARRGALDTVNFPTRFAS